MGNGETVFRERDQAWMCKLAVYLPGKGTRQAGCAVKNLETNGGNSWMGFLGFYNFSDFPLAHPIAVQNFNLEKVDALFQIQLPAVKVNCFVNSVINTPCP